jgi:hypothetical protein
MNPFTIAAGLLGFALITAGAACIYRPAGLLVAGLMLLLAAHGALRMPPANEN